MGLPQVGLEAVIANMQGFNASAAAIQKAYDAINSKADTVGKTTNKLGQDFVGLGSSLLNIGAIAGGAALAGVTALGAGLTGFAVSGISKAKDLDQQLANIASTMGVTKAAVGPLKQEILDLALDPNLTVNTTQAAQAIELLAQNGLTMTQILDGAAKSTVAMANATGADFGTAANIATGAMQAFNLEANDLTTVADGITGVLVTSKFTADDYAMALSNAGAIANSTGVSLQDFNAIIAATAFNFTSGSDAGTSLKTLLQRFANPTDEAKAAMQNLGISIFDSNGNMRDMDDIVGQLNKAFSGMTEEQKANTAAVIGGADASRTLLGLAGMTSEEFDTLSKRVNANGQAMKSAATRVDSLSGAWQIFQGVTEAVQIQVGDLFLPVLRQVTSWFTDTATRVGPMVVAFFGQVAQGIQGLIAFGSMLVERFQQFGPGGLLAGLGLEGGALLFKKLSELFQLIVGDTNTLSTTLATTLGGALSWLSTNLLPMITQGIQFVIGHFNEFKQALIGVGAALGAGIFAALVASLFALLTPVNLIIIAAGLLGAAWATNWGGIQEKTFAVWAVVQPILMQLGQFLMTNIPIALQALAIAWENVLLPAMSLVMDYMVGPMFNAIDVLANVWLSLASARLEALSKTWTDVLLPAITAIWNYFDQNIMPLWRTVVQFVDAVFSKAVETLAVIWRAKLLPALTAVWDFISKNVLPIFNEIWSAIAEKLQPAIGDITEEVFPPFQKGLEGITKWVKDLTGFFQGLTDAVKNFDPAAIITPGSPTPFEIGLRGIADAANAAGIGLGAMGRALQINPRAIDQLLGVARNIASIPNIIGSAADEVEELLDGMMEGSKARFALSKLKNLFRDNATKILGAADPKKMFENMALNSRNWGASGIGNQDIQRAASEFIGQFDKFKGILRKEQQQIFIEAGRTALTIGQKLNDIISGSADILNTRVESLRELVASGLATVNFEGQTISQLRAQELLNQALGEQLAIQDDLLLLKQNEAKLGFLEKQLNLIETINDAGLDVNAILGGLKLGINASIPDLIAATSNLVTAMIDQVDRDLQIASPSKVMQRKGLFTGQGFAEGIMGSLNGVMAATRAALSGPALVSGPALGAGGGNTYNFNNDFGGNNINSGMDEAQFNTKVLRAIQTLMR